MTTYISVVRDINVSGQKNIKMDTLRQLFWNIGFKKVQTYIQSGNVIFQDKSSETKDLEKKISEKIVEIYSFKVHVIVKELSELKEILLGNPFSNNGKADITKLHVTFLSSEPSEDSIEKLNEVNSTPDEF
jgi:uncharacterized protein (DUF1697 family)